ncbi:MAG: (d)CMP kinase [Acutalibacteraceae bacterium]|nr:(d)CMP kinase [Acutalibacteraceae bacterium]
MAINIAIDGPAGAGKSSIAKLVSKELGYIYVDTGALYRTVGLYSIRKGIDTKDAEAVTATLKDIEVKLGFVDGAQHVFLNGEDVSDAIRTPEASMGASNVSAIPAVRTFLFDLQRDIAKNNNCIMDGRDIGTVVLPDAQIKLFLTASPEARAERRYKELIEKGEKVDFQDVLDDINKRDYQDSHREIAPLKQAEDALLVDNSGCNLEEGVALVMGIIKEKLN